MLQDELFEQAEGLTVLVAACLPHELGPIVLPQLITDPFTVLNIVFFYGRHGSYVFTVWTLLRDFPIAPSRLPIPLHSRSHVTQGPISFIR